MDSPFRAATSRDLRKGRTCREAPGLRRARYVVLAVVPWAVLVGQVLATPSGDNFFRTRGQTGTPHPAVVRIMVPEGRSMSLGSGTLVAINGRHGLVVTNWHVIRDAADRIDVVFPDGFRSQATLLAADRDWDLAALAIWRPNVEPIRLAVEAPWPGDPLTIAGYGSGRYRTATGRCVQYVSPGNNLPFEMVELAATAREGDSGGPILNQRGELAGVLFGATWGRTAGSHTVPVRRFLASVSDKFDTLGETPTERAKLPQFADYRPEQPAEPELRLAHDNSRPPIREPDGVEAQSPWRIATEPSIRSTSLDVDGWVASEPTDHPTTADAPPIVRAAQPDEGPTSDCQAGSETNRNTQSPQWHDLLGPTHGEKAKTILAAIGLLTILFHTWRLLGKG